VVNLFQTFRAGDSFGVEFDLVDFPASEGWNLTYSMRGPQSIDITAEIEDGQYVVEKAAADTEEWKAGDYWVFVSVSLGGEKHTQELGQTQVLPSLASLETYDGRSVVKKTLDALESLIQGKALKDVESYTIGNRSLTSLSPSELMKWRNEYARLYSLELAEKKRKQGKKAGNRIVARF
jgi:hypothetical protein